MPGSSLSNWTRFLLHTSGAILLYFAIVFLLQSMFWRAGNHVQSFSSFFLGLCYVLALGCVWLLHGRELFYKSLFALPGFSKELLENKEALLQKNSHLVHKATPSLWIVLWIEVPLGLGLLVYEMQAWALQLFPAKEWQTWIVHFLPVRPDRGTLAWVGFLLSLSVFVPLSEELLFRGWGIGKMAHYFPRASLDSPTIWLALFWLNALFALFFWNPWQAFVMLPLGLVLSWIRIVSGSLWAVLVVRFMLSVWGLVFEFLGFFHWISPAPLAQDRLPWFFLLLAFFLFINSVWYLYKRKQRYINSSLSKSKQLKGAKKS